jgi:hypothetical protein
MKAADEVTNGLLSGLKIFTRFLTQLVIFGVSVESAMRDFFGACS